MIKGNGSPDQTVIHRKESRPKQSKRRGHISMGEIIIPQEEQIAPVFKKYEPAKNEVVFSYTTLIR